MKIKRICALCYSATGNTERVVTILSEALAERLHVPLTVFGFTKPQEREARHLFEQGDLVVVGTPTYAGKMPNKILPDFQSRLEGNGALAVAVVTFGGRSYDNALAELCGTLEADGFRVVAGGAFAAQHAFSDTLQAGRPNETDDLELKKFAEQITVKVNSLTDKNEKIEVPGDAAAPYYVPLGADGQPAKFLKAKPRTDLSRCSVCGTCAENCPMGAIDFTDPAEVTGICIKCHACVRKCPTHAKYFDDPAFLSHVAMLEEHYQALKPNETFL